jgi:CheY-like chemotaxis protein
VLVIDDELNLGKCVVRMLKHHDVALLTDGEAGFARLRDGALPDLVLCDLLMPGRTGIELYEALAQCRPEVLGRIVFMTGASNLPAWDQFVSRHSVRVISKPFPPGSLDALVASAIL